MPWIFEQGTGFLLSPTGQIVTKGYSGAPGYVDNPDDEAMQNKKTEKAALARQTVMDIGRCDHRIGLRQLAEFFATSTQTVAYSLAKIGNRKKSDPDYVEDRAEIVRLIKWAQK